MLGRIENVALRYLSIRTEPLTSEQYARVSSRCLPGRLLSILGPTRLDVWLDYERGVKSCDKPDQATGVSYDGSWRIAYVKDVRLLSVRVLAVYI